MIGKNGTNDNKNIIQNKSSIKVNMTMKEFISRK